MAENTEILNVRVTAKFKKLINRFLELDTHMNESELVRDAVRVYIQTNASGLYEELFNDTPNEEKGKI